MAPTYPFLGVQWRQRIPSVLVVAELGVRG
jgi:hypothetical protein